MLLVTKRTALHIAVQNDSNDAKELVQKGANVNAVDKHNWTALHYAVGKTVIAKVLIQNGADVNAVDNSETHTSAWQLRMDMVTSESVDSERCRCECCR